MLISPTQLFCYGLAVAGTVGIIGVIGVSLYLWFLAAIAPPAPDSETDVNETPEGLVRE